jgi:predicted nuclease of predicted toxin-antitoxin system
VRFLVDASCDARIAAHLRSNGHDVTRVGSDYAADLPDIAILQLAEREQRILITDDRDFGELVYRLRHPHAGVIYLRLDSTNIAVRCTRLDAALAEIGPSIDGFIVVTQTGVRLRRR